MWNTIAICVAAALSAPERVTLHTGDGFTLTADFFDLPGEAPTVICLPMLDGTRDGYAPIRAPFREAGLQVLALDLRGHGESAPELATRVAKRDEQVFQAMHRDVEAALAFLHARREDTSRVSLLGASAGCSLGIDAVVSDPSSYRSIALMSPGPNDLGLDTLELLERWPGVPALVLASTEDEAEVDPVAERLLDHAPDVTEYTVFEGGGIQGTRMFGKVAGVEAELVQFYRDTLLKPALAVPRFPTGVPLPPPGLERRKPKNQEVSRTRTVGGEKTRFSMSVTASDDTLRIGAYTELAFAGSVQLQLGGRTFAATWDIDVPGSVVFTSVGGEPLELAAVQSGNLPSFNIPGTNGYYVPPFDPGLYLALPPAEWMPEGETTLQLTFTPTAGDPVALPGGAAPFHAYLAER